MLCRRSREEGFFHAEYPAIRVSFTARIIQSAHPSAHDRIHSSYTRVACSRPIRRSLGPSDRSDLQRKPVRSPRGSRHLLQLPDAAQIQPGRFFAEAQAIAPSAAHRRKSTNVSISSKPLLSRPKPYRRPSRTFCITKKLVSILTAESKAAFSRHQK